MRLRHAIVLPALLLGVVGCSSGEPTHQATLTTTTGTNEVAGSAYEALLLPADTVTCEEATHSNDPGALIAAFNTARLAGHDAEGCLSDALAARYDDARCDYPLDLEREPGPVLLYGCGTHRIVAIPDELVEGVKSDHDEVQQRVFVDGRRGQPEHLVVKRFGTGSERRQMIIDASPI
jgi:hypothetical protein